MQDARIITIEKDLDEDRYITYVQFIDFIKTMQLFSKAQCFYLLLGITGFRPCEVARMTTENLCFDDENNPYILNKITKSKPQIMYDGDKKIVYDDQGRVLYTRVIKKKKRYIPVWVMNYIKEYLAKHFCGLKQDEDYVARHANA